MTQWHATLSRRRFLVLLGGTALGAAALTACGTNANAASGSASGGAGGDVPNGTYGGSKFSSAVVAQQVPVVALVNTLKWDKAQYTAAAGDVTFVVQNPATFPHQFGVEGNGVRYESGDLKPNTTTNLTVKGLKAGEYELVCNYPGHKTAGMVAVLTVA